MAEGFKEYRSVTDFPLHTGNLTKEEIEAIYQDIRKEYRNLSTSRSQLVRRQSEAKTKIRDLRLSLAASGRTLEEVVQLRQSLAHSVNTQSQIRDERDALTKKVATLKSQLGATTKLLDDFESVYNEVKEEKGLNAFFRLLQAARRLLTTDLKELTMKRAEVVDEDTFSKETPANINRNLLDQ